MQSVRCRRIFLGVLALLVCRASLAAGGGQSTVLPTAGFDRPCWSPDASRLAFSDHRRDRIYIRESDGSIVQAVSSPSSGYAYAWSPDGRQLAFKQILPANSGSGPLQQPVLFDVIERKLVPLHPASARVGVPSFSEHGRIAFTVDQELRITDRAGRLLQTFSLGNYANLTPISPDDRLIAYTDEHEQICILDLASGQRTKLTNGDAAFFNPIWSPDSTKILASTVSGQLRVIDLLTGSNHILDEGSSPVWTADCKTVLYCKADRVPGVRLHGIELRQIQYDGSRGAAVPAPAAAQAISLSRDGRKVAFVSLADAGLYEAPLTAARPPGQLQNGALAAAGDHALGAASRLVASGAAQQTSISLEPETAGTSAALASIVTLTRSVPYLHQAYDTPDDFNGDSACGATSANMCIAYYQRLPYWDVVCSWPYSHVSHYGQYICRIYSFNGYTYNYRSKDPSNNWGYGGFGYITRNNWLDTKGYMRDYFNNHNVSSVVDWSPTWEKLQAEVNNQYPCVVLNMLTTAGHYIVTIGYFSAQRTAVFNDPWGNKNTNPYVDYAGAGVYYDWPGYNNGYQNLNAAECFIYARSNWTSRADFNHDGHVNAADFTLFLPCFTGAGGGVPGGCTAENLDGDTDVDQADFGLMQRCFSGAAESSPNCPP